MSMQVTCTHWQHLMQLPANTSTTTWPNLPHRPPMHPADASKPQHASFRKQATQNILRKLPLAAFAVS